jgi:hypothetical protein
MKPTTLVQQLMRPLVSLDPDKVSPGEGVTAGALNKRGSELMNQLFTLLSMHSSNYDWGRWPAAINAFAAEPENIGVLAITDKLGSLGKPSFALPEWADAYKDLDMDKLGTTYVVAHKDVIDEAVARICVWAGEDPANPDMSNEADKHLAERTRLGEALLQQFVDSDKRGYPERIAWLELDNPFFFTVDKGTLKGFCKILGIDPVGHD